MLCNMFDQFPFNYIHHPISIREEFGVAPITYLFVAYRDLLPNIYVKNPYSILTLDFPRSLLWTRK